ncbi:bifunctional UDP-N-acetylglucosamine pyrophosphorylase/glucosamine-1-phosphate N-acetyltransferase [Friedmanniella endophytica]|uniref:Bifunctional protein GlmU n=1 Tax=Microlunatus kandeliicorticis TaxID=1759536 RepID=A0A7W3ISV2_9ACTN|nr:bifunctional UDP-N-acetylglucosamine diphosphorylase/glucosamine-1-phosphate N-acetyltransferase GlmU [Microlunatus kandeliicorticis]MBA8794585.1 bifunctional UDP-N-acetylglucosamine pyrophosphorylase/glucosamine-1-phosphate N-acetyltransferase [Microlunatus kandeliicorticis]
MATASPGNPDDPTPPTGPVGPDPDTDLTTPSHGVAAAVILAAGAGTRMKSRRSKLLHEIAGRSLLNYAVDAAVEAGAEHVVVVVGHQRDQVEAHLAEIAPHVTVAVQTDDAYGTGHAVRCGLRVLTERTGPLSGEVLVTYADVPMLGSATLTALVGAHRDAGASITVLTAEVDDPTGYGRIVRGEAGDVLGIVEHKDAGPAERAIREINSGIYVFAADVLTGALDELVPSPVTGELYLTDVLGIARRRHRPVRAHLTADRWEVEGVNDRVQLQRMGAEINRRLLERWMLAGVTVVDPASTWVHADVDLASDVTLLPNTSLEGATTVAEGAVIGPDVTLVDVEVGEGATVTRCQASLAVIGAGASVGPYAYLRPGTVLGAEGKIGTFVETKNARIGERAKVPHLTYAGDTEIGEGSNIGAGTIFANYDGVSKNPSSVGRDSFVGSGSVLIHPVEVGDGAYVAAGSAVTESVRPGQLGVARGRQRNVDGWVFRRRPDTRTAAAADRAGARPPDAADHAHHEQEQQRTRGRDGAPQDGGDQA